MPFFDFLLYGLSIIRSYRLLQNARDEPTEFIILYKHYGIQPHLQGDMGRFSISENHPPAATKRAKIQLIEIYATTLYNNHIVLILGRLIWLL